MRKPTFLLKPSAYKPATYKMYAILPENGDGDMDVNINIGNGTRVNKDGLIGGLDSLQYDPMPSRTPRIDYLGGVGLLLEPTRTNLMTYSYSNTGMVNWNSATNVANDAIAPDGSKKATKIIDAQTAGYSWVAKEATVTDTTATHTSSLFVKFGDRDYMYLALQTSGGTGTSEINLNLNNDGSIELVSDASGIYLSSKSVDYGNEWIRFEITHDQDTLDDTINFMMYPAGGSDSSNTYAQGYCWVWGFQVEEGNYATSYIPTISLAVERRYDNFDVGSLVANGLIGKTNGTIFIDVSYNETTVRDSSGAILKIGTTNGQILFYHNTNNIAAVVQSTDASYDTAYVNSSVAIEGADRRAKVAFVISEDNVDVWINGTKSMSTNKDFYFTSEILELSGEGVSSKIHEVTMYKKALTDNELKRITQ